MIFRTTLQKVYPKTRDSSRRLSAKRIRKENLYKISFFVWDGISGKR
ncbi:hypothetical protein LEP1GSC005_3754 [Leptospira santarosai str. ST188]|nr:hypothetical protein LEP1GSC005_3754 [Leptospira santarosai str. ST188]